MSKIYQVSQHHLLDTLGAFLIADYHFKDHAESLVNIQNSDTTALIKRKLNNNTLTCRDLMTLYYYELRELD